MEELETLLRYTQLMKDLITQSTGSSMRSYKSYIARELLSILIDNSLLLQTVYVRNWS